jgi:hypothetical protein
VLAHDERILFLVSGDILCKFVDAAHIHIISEVGRRLLLLQQLLLLLLPPAENKTPTNETLNKSSCIFFLSPSFLLVVILRLNIGHEIVTSITSALHRIRPSIRIPDRPSFHVSGLMRERQFTEICCYSYPGNARGRQASLCDELFNIDGQ